VHLDGSAACWGLDTYGGASPPSGTFAELGGGETSTAARSAGRAKTTRQSRRRWSSPPSRPEPSSAAGFWSIERCCVGVRT